MEDRAIQLRLIKSSAYIRGFRDGELGRSYSVYVYYRSDLWLDYWSGWKQGKRARIAAVEAFERTEKRDLIIDESAPPRKRRSKAESWKNRRAAYLKAKGFPVERDLLI